MPIPTSFLLLQKRQWHQQSTGESWLPGPTQELNRLQDWGWPCVSCCFPAVHGCNMRGCPLLDPTCLHPQSRLPNTRAARDWCLKNLSWINISGQSKAPLTWWLKQVNNCPNKPNGDRNKKWSIWTDQCGIRRWDQQLEIPHQWKKSDYYNFTDKQNNKLKGRACGINP